MQQPKTISYLPLGDSYTIGTGASEEDAWPGLLTRHLNEKELDAGCSRIRQEMVIAAVI